MAYRSSPSGTTAASMGPSPGASPTLPSSSPILGQVKVPQGALAIDDLLKRERVWWSEHTLLEVQKMEVTVKDELSKATAALRDHFCTQIENERNDNIQRVSALERSVSRLREEVDAVRAQQRQPAPTISSSFEAAVRRVSAELEQSEVNLRLELQALEAKVEDYHRANTEDLSVALAASQTTVEEMTALRNRASAAERSCETMMSSIQRYEKARNTSPQLDLARVREEARQIINQELGEECTRKQALMTQSTEPDLEATRKVDEDVMRLTIELEAERAARAEALEAESTARRTEVDGLRSDLARERSAHGRELEDARTAWLNEANSLREELSNEHLERAHELASIRIATEAAASTARITVPGSSSSMGNHIKELADGLFAERTQRKEEVQKLQAYIEKAVDEHLSKSATKEDTVRELAGFLEAECRARKADVEELRVSLAEATGLEALTSALAGLRTALEEEAEQSSAMRDKLADSAKSGGAGAGLVRELAYSGSGERRHAEAEARKSDISAALGKEATELVGRIRGLGGELRAELSTRLEIESTELRAEFGTRLELANAKLRAELEASKAELRRDIAAMCTDVHNATINELRGGDTKGQSFSTAGLQTSAAAVGQLNEVLRLMELMEALTEKICGETVERKRAEAHFEQRLAKMEHAGPLQQPAEVQQQLQPAPQVQGVPVATTSSTASGGPPDPQKAQERQLQHLQAQSVISRDLKNSLEKLVDRVQYMLKPDDGGMFSFSVPSEKPPSRSSSQAAVERQRSVPRDSQAVTPSPVLSRAGTSTAVLAPSAPGASRDEGTLPSSPQAQSLASRKSTDAPPGTPGCSAGAFAVPVNKVGQLAGNPSPVITSSSSHQNSVGGALPGPLAATAVSQPQQMMQQQQHSQIQPQPQLAAQQQAQAPQHGMTHAVMRMSYGTVAPNAPPPQAGAAGVFRAVGAAQGIWQTRVNIQQRPESRPW